jgi:Carboxypeptidase regulatory-like domain
MRGLFVPIAFCYLFLPAFAQTPDTATIQGRILDQSSGGIAGAKVIITNHNLNLDRSAQTSPKGDFSIRRLPGTPLKVSDSRPS